MGCSYRMGCPCGVPVWDGVSHLLQGGVLDGVGVVVVVDDLEVAHGRALPRPPKLHVQLSLAGPLRLHREVGGLPHLHACAAPSAPGPVAPTAPGVHATPPPAPIPTAPTAPAPQYPLPTLLTPTTLPTPPRHPPSPVPSPVRLSPGPSALTLLASWDGSTLMRNGLLGISWGERRWHGGTVALPGDGGQSPPTHTTSAGREVTARAPGVGQEGGLGAPYLVGEEHHDGVEPGARWRVLHREGVVVVLDDVKINVSLQRPHHAGGAFDADAHVPCEAFPPSAPCHPAPLGWHQGVGRDQGHGAAPGPGVLDQEWGCRSRTRDDGAEVGMLDQGCQSRTRDAGPEMLDQDQGCRSRTKGAGPEMLDQGCRSRTRDAGPGAGPGK